MNKYIKYPTNKNLENYNEIYEFLKYNWLPERLRTDKAMMVRNSKIKEINSETIYVLDILIITKINYADLF